MSVSRKAREAKRAREAVPSRWETNQRRRFDWYRRVMIDKTITRSALAREVGQSKTNIGRVIDKLDRRLRISLGLPGIFVSRGSVRI
jgi:hypothetical protein